jgi:uncharacterized membrane protein YphA (DoxX/SURF4 family)
LVAPLPSAAAYSRWLAAFRIYAGIVWLSWGVPKFYRPFLPPRGYMMSFLQTAIDGTSGPYHAFLVSVVVPHAHLFGQLVRWGEVLIGCALLFGLLTRAAALAGVLLALTYLPANAVWNQASTVADILTSADAYAIAISALHLALPTGLVFGLDARVWQMAHVIRYNGGHGG